MASSQRFFNFVDAQSQSISIPLGGTLRLGGTVVVPLNGTNPDGTTNVGPGPVIQYNTPKSLGLPLLLSKPLAGQSAALPNNVTLTFYSDILLDPDFLQQGITITPSRIAVTKPGVYRLHIVVALTNAVASNAPRLIVQKGPPGGPLVSIREIDVPVIFPTPASFAVGTEVDFLDQVTASTEYQVALRGPTGGSTFTIAGTGPTSIISPTRIQMHYVSEL